MAHRFPHWFLCICLFSSTAMAGDTERANVIDVEPVWTGHPVGFSLLTVAPRQYVAYYDAHRQMTVAQRRLDTAKWTIVKLPPHVGWDSHNYVTMAIDRSGHLHVAGNMHCVPLVYFRTTTAGDARSLVRVGKMVGPEREKRMTYPLFLLGPGGQLIFRYRDGSSGNGDDIFNAYEEATHTWKRLLDRPLTSGQGKMNAYCSRPALGLDNFFHVVWVWRDTPDCATNHDLSYARSRDLIHWETASGKALTLPITTNSGAIVDPVPAHGGIINGGQRLGFDSSNRPVIAYHKYDALGNTQIYVARFEQGTWNIRQISNWTDYRWDFHGGGSIPFEVRLGGIGHVDRGLRIACTYGRGRASWTLNESTLEPYVDAANKKVPTPGSKREATGAKVARSSRMPPVTGPSTELPKEGMRVRFANDLGTSSDGDRFFRLRWHSLGPNRDRPRKGSPPPPGMLQVLEYSK